MNIIFYIPEGETVPTKLRLRIEGGFNVVYEQIDSGFRFFIDCKDEKYSMKIAEEIVRRIKNEHDNSWRTVSLNIIPQDERYRIDTIIEWKYRPRDFY